MVKSREGEPVPIPYCDLHLKSGDGALKVVRHPFAGKCLVARSVLFRERGSDIASDYHGMNLKCTHVNSSFRLILDSLFV